MPHLYAGSRDDLFVAQGFNAARDRLFQIDLWRRRGLGLLSEVFGDAYVEHDRAARLFLYRGDMHAEWRAYGSDTKRVTSAFVRGVNAFVALCREQQEHLRRSSRELGYLPAYWDASDVARIRGHGLFYNLEQEVARALTLRDHGPRWRTCGGYASPDRTGCACPTGWTCPSSPTTSCASTGWRPRRRPPGPAARRGGLDGSNNWVIAPSRTATGRPLLANDPHRAVTLPSLRYIAHLSAPGLDVIGAGEPALPGISIGHNGRDRVRADDLPDRPGGPVRLPDQPGRPARVRLPRALGADGARPRDGPGTRRRGRRGRAVVHPARPGDRRSAPTATPPSPYGPRGWSRAWRPTSAAWTT